MQRDVVIARNNETVGCCHCGEVLGEEQFAVYIGRRVLWACSAACRAQYHTTQTQEPAEA
jgi:hypothetical protein